MMHCLAVSARSLLTVTGITIQVTLAEVATAAQKIEKEFMNAQLNMGNKKAPPFGRAFESDNLLLCQPVIQLGAGD